MKFYGGQGAVRWAIYYNSPMKIDKFLFGSAQLFHFHFHFRCLVMATGHAFALNPHATELLMVRWLWWCHSMVVAGSLCIPPPNSRIPWVALPALSRLLSLCCDSIYLCFNRCVSSLCRILFVLASKHTLCCCDKYLVHRVDCNSIFSYPEGIAILLIKKWFIYMCNKG